MSVKKYRSRTFFVLLYPDNYKHVEVFEKIQKTYEFVAIEHDKDTDEGGELKKRHIHVFLKFKNAKWNTAVLEELGLEPRFLEEIKSEKAALQYLLHANEENKYHYDISELQGSKSLIRKLKEYLKADSASPEEQFAELARAIYTFNISSYSELLEYAAFKGMVKELRSSSYMLSRMVDENRRGQVCAVKSHEKRSFEMGAGVERSN